MASHYLVTFIKKKIKGNLIKYYKIVIFKLIKNVEKMHAPTPVRANLCRFITISQCFMKSP